VRPPLNGSIVGQTADIVIMDEHESKTAVDAQWASLLARQEELVGKIAAEAARKPTLRRLYPFAAHSELHFSRNTSYPYDHLPFIAPLPSGLYEGCDFAKSLGTGDLSFVVQLVADAVDARIR
jgi:hypothetical protein